MIDCIVVNKNDPALETFLKEWRAAGYDHNLIIASIQPTDEDYDVVYNYAEDVGLQHISFFDRISYAHAVNLTARRSVGSSIALFQPNTVFTDRDLEKLAMAAAAPEAGYAVPAVDDLVKPYAVSGAWSSMIVVSSEVWDELTICPNYQQKSCPVPFHESDDASIELFVEHANWHGYEGASRTGVIIKGDLHGGPFIEDTDEHRIARKSHIGVKSVV